MKHPILILILSLLLTPALSTVAEIYKSVGADGKVHFTDNPTAGQKVNEVDLPPINTQPGTPLRHTRPPEETAPLEYQIELIAPSHETLLGNEDRDLMISVSLWPQLQPGHTLQAYLNGTAFGPSSTSLQWTLTEIHRGEHQVSAAVLDENGQTLAQTPSVTIYVQRRSVILQPKPKTP